MAQATTQASTPKVQSSEKNEAGEVAIQIVGMNKWYGEFHVLRDINLTV